MKLFFVTQSGSTVEAEAEPGRNLMEVAVDALVPGVYGDCGGGCSCGTCHVQLPAELAEQLQAEQPKSDLEHELLENSENYCAQRSRLGCQVCVRAGMDGAVIKVASN